MEDFKCQIFGEHGWIMVTYMMAPPKVGGILSIYGAYKKIVSVKQDSEGAYEVTVE